MNYSATLRNAQLDAITTAVGNAGLMRIYSGTKPANVAAAITGTLLSEGVCGSPFAPGASSGVLTPTTPVIDSAANSTGTASHFRVFKADGTTAVIDGTVGTSGCDLNIGSVSIVTGGEVSVTSWTITAGNA